MRILFRVDLRAVQTLKNTNHTSYLWLCCERDEKNNNNNTEEKGKRVLAIFLTSHSRTLNRTEQKTQYVNSGTQDTMNKIIFFLSCSLAVQIHPMIVQKQQANKHNYKTSTRGFPFRSFVYRQSPSPALIDSMQSNSPSHFNYSLSLLGYSK